MTPDELHAIADAATPGLGVINSDGTVTDEWLIDHAPDLARLVAEMGEILHGDGYSANPLTAKSLWLTRLAGLEAVGES
jgi:hypothetical protein